MPLFNILAIVDGQEILWAGIEAGNTDHAREIMEAHYREPYQAPNPNQVLSVVPTKEKRDGCL